MTSRRGTRWAMALVLVVGLLGSGPWPGYGPLGEGRGGPGAAAAAAARVRHPILFVDSSARNAKDLWSCPPATRPEYASLWDRLADMGYTPGKDLFSLSLSSGLKGDYTESYRTLLIPAIRKAKEASGAATVDIIATGLGALAARFYTVCPEYAGDVGTLVMVAPPNRGSLAATLLRSSSVSDTVARILAASPQYVSPRAGGVPDPTPLKEELERAARQFPPFTSEAAYVTSRARDAYEPLLAYYRKAIKWEPRPDIKSNKAKMSFEEWLADEMPDVYLKCLARAQDPPITPDYTSDGPTGPPGPGMDLSRAYYETLAISAAQQSLTKTTLRAKAVPIDLGELLTSVLPATDPRGAAIRWIAALAARLGLKWLAQNQQSLAVSAARTMSGADPGDVAFDRLVKTDLVLPVGHDYAGRPVFERLVANYFLDAWNRADLVARTANEKAAFFSGDSRPGPNVRYVTIAGSVSNPYAAFIPWARENDLFTEVDSALLTPGRDDILAVFRSTLTAGAGMLTHSETVHRFISQALSWNYPTRARLAPTARTAWSLWTWEKTGSAEAEAWSPGYIEIDSARLPGLPGLLEVDLDFPPSPPGLVPRAWVYRESGDGRWVEQEELTLRPDPLRPGATVSVKGFAGAYRRVLVGFRYVPDPAFGESAAVPQKPVAANLTYTARFKPVVASKGGVATPVTVRPGASDPAGPGPVSGLASGFVSAPPSPSAPGPSAGQRDGPAAGAPAEDEPETIRVIRHSKETTHLDPVETKHQAWVWDFGDGTVWRDDDPANWRAKVSHVYAKPGKYEVTGRSTTSDGRALTTRRWVVDVAPEAGGQGEKAREEVFEASSVGPLAVLPRLSGPVEWVTGRPADFYVQVQVERPDNCTGMIVEVDPGNRFRVIWERPGRFLVAASVVVNLDLVLDGETVRIRNVYRSEMEVNVLALSITD